MLGIVFAAKSSSSSRYCFRKVLRDVWKLDGTYLNAAMNTASSLKEHVVGYVCSPSDKKTFTPHFLEVGLCCCCCSFETFDTGSCPILFWNGVECGNLLLLPSKTWVLGWQVCTTMPGLTVLALGRRMKERNLMRTLSWPQRTKVKDPGGPGKVWHYILYLLTFISCEENLMC